MDDMNKECGCNHEHDHDHDHECGCGHDHEQMMSLVLEDNTEMKCSVLGVFDANEKEYIALLPVGEDEVLLYQYAEGEDGEGFELLNIESDEEFAAVEEVFFELYDSEDFEDDEEYDDEEGTEE